MRRPTPLGLPLPLLTASLTSKGMGFGPRGGRGGGPPLKLFGNGQGPDSFLGNHADGGGIYTLSLLEFPTLGGTLFPIPLVLLTHGIGLEDPITDGTLSLLAP